MHSGSFLIDRSKSLFYNKTCNIIWATDNYSPLGEGFKIDDPILSNNIINEYGLIIRPRVKKTKTEQVARARNKAEVFTPSWLCNKQNNLVDENWFGEKFLFNKEINFLLPIIDYLLVIRNHKYFDMLSIPNTSNHFQYRYFH